MYPVPPQSASTNYQCLVNPAYLSLPMYPYCPIDPNSVANLWVPVIDNVVMTGTNAAGANSPMSLLIEGVGITRHNMSANGDFYFQDDFPSGYPLHTNGSPPTLTAMDSYTTADNINYAIQGGNLGANNAVATTWRTAGTYRIRYFDLNIDKVGSPTDDVYITLNTTDPNGAIVSTSSRISGIDLSTTKGYVRFGFPEAQVQSPGFGSNYAICMFRTGAKDTTNYYRWYGTNSSGYANGATWTMTGGIWSNTGLTDDQNWKVYSGYRVQFNTSNSTNNNMTITYHYTPGSQLRE